MIDEMEATVLGTNLAPEIEKNPHYATVHAAIEEALHEFVIGPRRSVTFTDGDIAQAGADIEAMKQCAASQALESIEQDLRQSVTFCFERDESTKQSRVTGSVVCMSEARLAELLSRITTNVVRAVSAIKEREAS